MKKTRGVVLSILALIIVGQFFFLHSRAASELALDDPVRLNDMALSLLTPAIQEAVDQYYAPYLTIQPTVMPFVGMTMVDIQGGEEIHERIWNSHYTVTVEVLPYVGPHLDVGRDRAAIEITPSGVTVIGYEHLESCDLPAHYQSIIKMPLP